MHIATGGAGLTVSHLVNEFNCRGVGGVLLVDTMADARPVSPLVDSARRFA